MQCPTRHSTHASRHHAEYVAPRLPGSISLPEASSRPSHPPLSHYLAQYARPNSSQESSAPQVQSAMGRAPDDGRRRPCMDCRAGPLPEIFQKPALHATSRHPTTQSATAPFHLHLVWQRRVPYGVVNPRRIDGMQGVRGSNPLSSTPGHRPNPGPTVRDSAASGSKSAAVCAARVIGSSSELPRAWA